MKEPGVGEGLEERSGQLPVGFDGCGAGADLGGEFARQCRPGAVASFAYDILAPPRRRIMTTRRDFLRRTTVGAAAVGVLGVPAFGAAQGAPPGPRSS